MRIETEVDHAELALAVDQAVTQWRAMERKAAAWDDLRALISQSKEPIAPQILALMDGLVHPARSSSI